MEDKFVEIKWVDHAAWCFICKTKFASHNSVKLNAFTILCCSFCLDELQKEITAHSKFTALKEVDNVFPVV